MLSKKKKMSRNSEPQSTGVNLICEGTTLKGDIEAEKDFRIDGRIIGTLHIKGKVVVGATGNIEGDILCKTVDILGTVTGNIKVSELASIKEGANVKGDIFSSQVAVEPGAKITGSCNIGTVDIEKQMKKENQAKKK